VAITKRVIDVAHHGRFGLASGQKVMRDAAANIARYPGN
jgi:hypothetical protein